VKILGVHSLKPRTQKAACFRVVLRQHIGLRGNDSGKKFDADKWKTDFQSSNNIYTMKYPNSVNFGPQTA